MVCSVVLKGVPMKKLICLFLCVVMLCPVLASAEAVKEEASVYDVSPVLSNPSPSAEAQELMNWMCENYGTRMISGQYLDEGRRGQELEAIAGVTGGLYPAMIGLDMMNYSPSSVSLGARPVTVDQALDYWKAGYLVTFCWHWRPDRKYMDTTGTSWWGGFYTENTTFSLEKAMNGEDPEGFLATSAEDVMACRGSSFRISPTLAKLNEALKADEYKKIAVVGTACKTLATYKMLAKPYPDRDNNADNIGLVIGLFCGWGLDWDGLKELAAKYVPLDEIAHMDIPPSKYHSLVIRRKDGSEVSIDLDEVTPLVRPACKACDDMTAEFADISVGSGRSADGWDVDKGWNELIVRSEKGAKLLQLARKKGMVSSRRACSPAEKRVSTLLSVMRSSCGPTAKALFRR